MIDYNIIIMKVLSIACLSLQTASLALYRAIPNPIRTAISSCLSTIPSSQSLCRVCRVLLIKVLGPFFVILATSLISTAMFLFLTVFINELSYKRIDLFCIHILIGTYFYVNIMFNYFLCVFTSPGEPPKLSSLESRQHRVVDGVKVAIFPRRLDISPSVSYRYCKVCDCIKPPRCHHDSISGRCVLNMDHYCASDYILHL